LEDVPVTTWRASSYFFFCYPTYLDYSRIIQVASVGEEYKNLAKQQKEAQLRESLYSISIIINLELNMNIHL